MQLGMKVRDKITGFSGTATARAEYLNDTPQVRVERSIGDEHHERWFAESRLEQIDVEVRG